MARVSAASSVATASKPVEQFRLDTFGQIVWAWAIVVVNRRMKRKANEPDEHAAFSLWSMRPPVLMDSIG